MILLSHLQANKHNSHTKTDSLDGKTDHLDGLLLVKETIQNI